MKKAFEKALKAKEAQRQRNATRSVEEKLRVVDRLHATAKKLRNSTLAGSGRRPQGR